MLLRLSRAVGACALAAAPLLAHAHSFAARHDAAPLAPLLSHPRPAMCVEETSRTENARNTRRHEKRTALRRLFTS